MIIPGEGGGISDFDQDGGNIYETDNKYQENLPAVHMTRLLATDSKLNGRKKQSGQNGILNLMASGGVVTKYATTTFMGSLSCPTCLYSLRDSTLSALIAEQLPF